MIFANIQPELILISILVISKIFLFSLFYMNIYYRLKLTVINITVNKL